MNLNPTLKSLPNPDESKSEGFFVVLKYIGWVLKLNFRLLPSVVTFRTLYVFYNNIDPVIHGYIWGKVLDALVQKDINTIQQYFIVYLFVLALSFMISVVGDRIDAYGKQTSMYKYRLYFADIISSLGIPKLENPKIANQIYRINESYQEMWNTTQRISSLISSVISVTVALAIVVGANWLFALAIFITVVVRAYVHAKELKEDWKFLTMHTENRRIVESHISAINRVDSLKEVLQSNSYEFFRDRYDSFLKWFYGVVAKMRIRKGIYDATFEILFVIIIGFMISNFIQQYLNDQITIGQITFYISSFRTYISSMKSLLGVFVSIGEAKERIKDSYEIAESTSMSGNRKLKSKLESSIDIDVKNINFTYPESKKEVISDLSLSIKQGEKIAIVGENGAGKTTLVSLILGFYPVTSGSILVNGKDLNTLDLRDWYRQIGMLMQSFNNYEFLSLEDNITLGVKDENRLNKMMKMFGVSDFASKYEFGKKQMLSSRFTNGIVPSGGQWQKIAMARTLYRNTPVVVLDEPTSALDPVSEAEIFENLFEELNGKTVIIISHRFSTVKKADRIVVMKEGRIVEEGSHSKLMKLDGVYAKSYRLQADSYRD